MQLSSVLNGFIKRHNQIQNQFGNFVAWGSLTLVLITALVVILRYGLNTGSIAMQESIMYNHAILFMLGIAYTYLHNEHVRVDVFYGQFSPQRKAWVNLIGSLLFTLPVMFFILWSGWDYVSASWQIKETSAEAGGLAYLYMLKSLILIMAILMIMQALSVMAQAYLTLFGQGYQEFESHDAGGKL